MATICEVLNTLSDAEWAELDNALLRHLIDGFVLRGEVYFEENELMLSNATPSEAPLPRS